MSLPSGLTPDQHRFLRTQLALIPAYVWLVDMWRLFIRQLPLPSDATHAHLVRDFLHFYVQGVIAREHAGHALYDINEMAAVAERVLPGIPKHVFPPVYGPHVALLFQPLASLSYLHALYVWLAITCVGTLVCLFLVWRHCPGSTPQRAWVLGVLAIGVPGLHFTLSFAQASVIGVAALTWLWLALRSGRPFLAGVAVGLLAYKPQLGILPAMVFLWRREWWVVFGAIVSVGVQLVVAAAFWGVAIFRDYVEALQQLPAVLDAMEPDVHLAYSVRAVASEIGLSSSAAWLASGVLSAAVVVWVCWTWRASVPVERRYAGLVLGTLAINPHLYGYDLLLAAPAMLVAALHAWSAWDRPLLVALGCLYVAPVISGVTEGPPWFTTASLFVCTGLILGHFVDGLSDPVSQVFIKADDL